MKVLYENTQGMLKIFIQGELDEYHSNSVRTQIDEILFKEKYNTVIFDMSLLDFMDSTGVGVLIGRYKQIKHKNYPMYICRPSINIDKVLKMSGIYNIMPQIDK